MTCAATGGAAGKVVSILRGLTQGMSASHARVLAEAGASVIATDLQEEAGSSPVEEITAATGRTVAAFTPVNVTRFRDWTVAVGDAVRTFGALRVLVNNAGS